MKIENHLGPCCSAAVAGGDTHYYKLNPLMRFGNPSMSMMPVTKYLVIVNVIIWLAMMFVPEMDVRVNNLLALHYPTDPDFNPAQIFTYMFLHSTQSLFHIMFNMLTLFIFGSALEYVLGSKRFLFYYVACGVGAALIQLLVFFFMIQHLEGMIPEGSYEVIDGQLYGNPIYMDSIVKLFQYKYSATVGASGAIYGLLLAYGMLFPERKVYIYFLMPVKAKWMVIIWALMELAMGFGVNDNVGHFCHLGGMLIGLVIILWWRHRKVIGRYY